MKINSLHFNIHSFVRCFIFNKSHALSFTVTAIAHIDLYDNLILLFMTFFITVLTFKIVAHILAISCSTFLFYSKTFINSHDHSSNLFNSSCSFSSPVLNIAVKCWWPVLSFLITAITCHDLLITAETCPELFVHFSHLSLTLWSILSPVLTFLVTSVKCPGLLDKCHHPPNTFLINAVTTALFPRSLRSLVGPMCLWCTLKQTMVPQGKCRREKKQEE